MSLYKNDLSFYCRSGSMAKYIFMFVLENPKKGLKTNIFLLSAPITIKGHKSKLTTVNGETFRNYFIFLPAYSLTIWVMRSSKNFEKIAILKT
jgi:hypothetical protein